MAIKMIDKEWCAEVKAYRKEFIIDGKADIANLPECCVGSTALVVATGDVYVVNASGEWVDFNVEV